MNDFVGSRQSANATAKIVTVAALGRPARRPDENAARLTLTARIIGTLIDQTDWHPIDGLLFPAGFFRHGAALGGLDPASRAKILAGLPLIRRLIAQLGAFSAPSRGIVLIVGVDTNRLAGLGYRGDQLMIALSNDGVIGVARKNFPSDADTNGWWQRPYVVNAADFDDPSRRVVLASGATAELSVCYDAFAYSEMHRGRTSNRRHLQFGFTDAGSVAPVTANLRDAWMAAHLKRLATPMSDVALVGIHGFEHPGRDGYWQRHGLATVSAATMGRACLGAAHFATALPSLVSSPLAASGVPRKHLDAGGRRRAHALNPKSSILVSQQGREVALLRLFEV